MVAAPFVVTPTTTASRIIDYSPGRSSVIIFNAGTVTVYIGTGEGLSSDNGIPILANTGLVFAREYGDDPDLARYAITATGTGNLRIVDERTTGVVAVLEQILAVLKGGS